MRLLRHTAICLLMLLSVAAYGQLTVTTGVNASALVSRITGPGVTSSNISINCHANAYGTFDGTNSNVGIANGVLLTTGKARNAIGPNTDDGLLLGTDWGWSSNDPDLATLEPAGTDMYDECVLEFDLVPSCDSIGINYVFASEEYLEYVGSTFNDAFGFFLTGPNPAGGTYNAYNIARIPNTTIPVAINNLYNDPTWISNYTSGPSSSYPQYYVRNGNGFCSPVSSCTNNRVLQYNGFTVPLLAKARVTPCETYHMKLIIGDAGDGLYDSGVFLTTGGITCITPPGLQFTTSYTLNCTNPNGGTATVNVTGGTAPYTYTWRTNPPQNTATATGLSAGTYTVVVSDQGCFLDSTTVTLVSTGPTLATSHTDVTCNGAANGTGTVVASVGTPGYTYLWSNTQTTSTINSLAPGTYKVTVTDQAGCLGIDSVVVTEPTALSVALAATGAGCGGGSNGSVTATPAGGSPNYTYAWSVPGSSNSITGLSPGNYSVTVTDNNGCSTSATATVNNGATGIVNLGPDTVLCNGQPIVLDAGFSSGVTWSTNATTQTISPTTSGTYSVTVEYQPGCFANDDIEVTFSTPFTVDLGNDTDICTGQTVVLDAGNPGLSYLWSTTDATQTISATTTGTYTVTVTDANGCSISDDKTVTVHTLPTVNLGNDIDVCVGTPVTLDAGNVGATYAWSTTATSQTISPTTSNTYSVTVTDAFQCQGTDDINVTFEPIPTVSLGNDTDICNGQSVVLDAGNAGATYLWSTTDVTQTITVNSSGTYSVTVTNTGNCTATDSKVVTVHTLPTVNLGSDINVCAGTPVTLDAGNAGATYAWSTTATTQTISPTTTNTYSVTVTDAFQCQGTDDIDVTFNPIPTVNLGNDADICTGQSVTLDAGNAGASYLWSTTDVTQTISVNATGTYTVTVTDANNCTASDAKDVTVHALPTVNLGSDISTCIGQPVTLDAGNAGATYVWSTTATSQTISPTTSNTYSVTVTDAYQCVGTDDILVTFNPLPTVSLGNDQTLCAGQPVTLDAGNVGATYAWSTTATSQTINPTTTGTYTVTVTDANGCTGTDNVSVTFVPVPVVNLGNDVSVCFGQTVTLDAGNAGANFHWSSNQASQTINPTTSGSYAVTVTNGGICVDSDRVEVNFLPLPVPTVHDTSTCIGDTIVLDAGISGAQYAWSNNATTQTTAVATENDYTVTVTDANNCSGTKTAHIGFHVAGSIDLGTDTFLCPGQQIVLDATFNGARYNWSTGSTSPSINVTQPGTYQVALTVNNHCTFGDTIEVGELTEVAVTLQDSSICPGDVLLLDATNPGASYVWSTGQTSSTIQVSDTGTYAVSVTNQCNSAAASMAVTFKDCDCHIYLPNVFSPNGDGINDVYKVARFCDSLQNFEMKIFDRWGELVFKTNDPNQGWDGVYHGNMSEPGVFAVVVTYSGKESDYYVDRIKKGSITLMR